MSSWSDAFQPHRAPLHSNLDHQAFLAIARRHVDDSTDVRHGTAIDGEMLDLDQLPPHRQPLEH